MEPDLLLDGLEAADRALTNLEADSEVVSSAVAAARAAINAARAAHLKENHA